jgi:diguanylate cyclase (GGDEF)-like protein
MNLAAVATAAGVAYVLGWLTRQPEIAAARREASTDALTGLVNRHGLKRQLRNRAERRQPYTIYMIDLNGFKPVNDALGHRAGDELLRQLGRRLDRGLSTHLVARLGGDEFMVIDESGLPGALVDTLSGLISRPFLLPGSPEMVSLSAAIGLLAVAAGADYRAAMHAADLAMYRSKHLGEPVQIGTLLEHGVDESPRSRIRDARSVRVA